MRVRSSDAIRLLFHVPLVGTEGAKEHCFLHDKPCLVDKAHWVAGTRKLQSGQPSSGNFLTHGKQRLQELVAGLLSWRPPLPNLLHVFNTRHPKDTGLPVDTASFGRCRCPTLPRHRLGG